MTQEWIKALELEKELYYPYFEEELKFLQKNIQRGSLIDLGCGDGRISQELKGNYTTYTGVDIDEQVIEELKKTENDNVNYVHSNVLELPFEDHSFNTSLCLTTYSNFGKNLDSMLKESTRILKPKGVFIASCYHEEALEKRLKVYSEFGDIIEKIDEKGTVYFKEGVETNISCQHSENKIEKDLYFSGLKLQEIQKSGPFYLFKAVKK